MGSQTIYWKKDDELKRGVVVGVGKYVDRLARPGVGFTAIELLLDNGWHTLVMGTAEEGFDKLAERADEFLNLQHTPRAIAHANG